MLRAPVEIGIGSRILLTRKNKSSSGESSSMCSLLSEVYIFSDVV
jgi:hypothetical protein